MAEPIEMPFGELLDEASYILFLHLSRRWGWRHYVLGLFVRLCVCARLGGCNLNLQPACHRLLDKYNRDRYKILKIGGFCFSEHQVG